MGAWLIVSGFIAILVAIFNDKYSPSNDFGAGPDEPVSKWFGKISVGFIGVLLIAFGLARLYYFGNK